MVQFYKTSVFTSNILLILLAVSPCKMEESSVRLQSMGELKGFSSRVSSAEEDTDYSADNTIPTESSDTIDVSDFKEMVLNNKPLIDKTLFIEEIMRAPIAETITITRPPGFGKTLNLSMLKYFLSSNETCKTLFDDFKIADRKEFCQTHQFKYPVAHISFGTVTQPTFNESMIEIKAILQRLYQDHSYLGESDRLDGYEKDSFASILKGNVSDDSICWAFGDLPQLLKKHHGAEVVYLLDDYDTPFVNGYFWNFYDEIRAILEDIIGAIFNNRNLRLGVMMGVVNLRLGDMFSPIHNGRTYPVIDEKYASYFGFTENEVKSLISLYEVQDSSILKDNKYNGYRIGDEILYNPWAVFECLREGGNSSHWLKTETIDQFYSKMTKFGVIPAVKSHLMLNDIPISQYYQHFVNLKKLNVSENTFWTFMVHQGFLTIRNVTQVGSERLCDLVIPNEEIKIAFNRVREYLNTSDAPNYDWFVNNFFDQGYTQLKASVLGEFLQESAPLYPGDRPAETVGGFIRGAAGKFGKFEQILVDALFGDAFYLFTKNTTEPDRLLMIREVVEWNPDKDFVKHALSILREKYDFLIELDEYVVISVSGCEVNLTAFHLKTPATV